MYEIEHTKNQPDFYYVMENIMNIAKIRTTIHTCLQLTNNQRSIPVKSYHNPLSYKLVPLTADQYWKSDQALHSSPPPAPSLCNRTMHWEIVIHHSQLWWQGHFHHHVMIVLIQRYCYWDQDYYEVLTEDVPARLHLQPMQWRLTAAVSSDQLSHCRTLCSCSAAAPVSAPTT